MCKVSDIRRLVWLLAMGLALTDVGSANEVASNIIVSEWQTPYGMPPFEEMPHDQFIEAYDEAARLQNEAIRKIVENKARPTFENTIEAYERSRSTLYRVLRAFIPMSQTISNETLKEAAKYIFPAFAAHEEAIFLNRNIFNKVDTLYQKRDGLDLTDDQIRLIELIHLEFVKYGVGVDDEQKPRLEAVSKEIAALEQEFIANNREESNAYELLIEGKEALGNMPASVVSAAEKRAEEAGHDCDCYSFSLTRSVVTPFLTYVADRDKRKQLYDDYYALGSNNNEWNNVEIVNRVLALRAERARILGYETYADFRTAYSMSETPENVLSLLDTVWAPAKRETEEVYELLQTRMQEDHGDETLRPWDWQYYAELVKGERYSVSDDVLRPYFPLDQVTKGAFDMANRLFGVTFVERQDLPRWHPDQDVYQVMNEDGEHLGLVLMDWYARESKRNGIWTDEIRVAEKMDDDVTGIAACNFNFPRGDDDTPALLSQFEAAAVFHELGHALHTLLSTQTYVRLSGFNYWPRDAVEFPPQILEYWFYDPSFMRTFAKHYDTGETIPERVTENILNAAAIDKGFTAVRQAAASYLDLAMHRFRYSESVDVLNLQEEVFDDLGLPKYIDSMYLAPFFLHAISGGYDSTFYGYLWSDVMAADAFGAFRENGLFDEATADSLRIHIFESGASKAQLDLFEAFRGRRPSPDAMIREMGLD